jgi:hypothetical protein
MGVRRGVAKGVEVGRSSATLQALQALRALQAETLKLLCGWLAPSWMIDREADSRLQSVES